jgi:preprotein translocase subunit SecF
MFDVIKYKTISFLFSGILCLLSLIAIVFWGFTPGIDFTGGSLLEISFSETRPTLEEIQTTVENHSVRKCYDTASRRTLIYSKNPIFI